MQADACKWAGEFGLYLVFDAQFWWTLRETNFPRVDFRLCIQVLKLNTVVLIPSESKGQNYCLLLSGLDFFHMNILINISHILLRQK